MKQNFKKLDVEEYILSHINTLQEILLQFNYPNFSNFMKLMKSEFLWQSRLSSYLVKENSIPQPIVIDVTDNKEFATAK